MSNKKLGKCLFIRDDYSQPYDIIDTSGWQTGEVFIGLSTGEDLPKGEEWFLYYPWQGETKIDHRFEDGRLWVNGHVAGIDLRKLKLDDLEDKTTVVTVKAFPAHLKLVQKLPDLLALEILKGKGDLSPLAKLTTLTKLMIWPEINDTHLLYLERLENLKELRLIGSEKVPGITDDGLKHLAGLTELKELIISGFSPGITDDGLNHLAGFTNLRVLGLSGTKITNMGLVFLKGFKNLSKLYLRNSMITDAGLEYLGCFTNLTELSLQGTAITDKGLKYLKPLRNLKFLNLSTTKVTIEGIERLKLALPGCKFYCEDWLRSSSSLHQS